FKLEIEISQWLLNFFQEGGYCYFIVSPPEMRKEYTTHSITDFIGYTPERLTWEKLHEYIHPYVLNNNMQFAATITEFRKNLPTEKVMKYKTRYDFRIQCKNGNYKRLLQQVIPIQTDEDGAILRTFVIFTDISHLKQNNKMVLSILGLEGEPSYFDIQPVQKLIPHKEILSRREKEVLQLLADNHSSKKVGEILSISPYTVNTHRKNMFRKPKT